jgi:hypothetical protein
MSNSMIEHIKDQNYLVTEAEIEQLAAMHTDVSNTQGAADGSYLKILLAGCQAELGKGKRKGPNHKEIQHKKLDEVHLRYYQAVLRGVTTPDIEFTDGLEEDELRRRRVEQLRRATFARSAKSTLYSYVDTGGDMRTLDVATTTKNGLRKVINEAMGLPTWEQAVGAKRAKIENICRKLAQTNPGQAREILESVLQHLQDVLDSITGGDRVATEQVVVFTAASTELPTVVEVPENFGEQTEGVVPASAEDFHIPEAHEFSEVASA